MEKPLITLTVGEFIAALREGLGLTIENQREDEHVDHPHRYVYGIAGLRDLLGCSESTANRIKRTGVLNPAISQHGKTIVIDADLALDLLRVSKQWHGTRGGYRK